MELKKQFWIAIQAIGRLLWLVAKEIFIFALAGINYVYRHRRQIARHKLTIPALVMLSISWTGYSVYSHVQFIKQASELSVDDPEAEEQIFQLSSYSTSDDNARLFDHINEWIGTPHRDGKSSKLGTDCSGFVQAVYRDALQIDLSRNSEEMYRNDVEKIAKSELNEGDLVFFNTYGDGISHVGIYMGEGKFAHTSSSRGVTIDSMESPYYVANYYASGRVIK